MKPLALYARLGVGFNCEMCRYHGTAGRHNSRRRCLIRLPCSVQVHGSRAFGDGVVRHVSSLRMETKRRTGRYPVGETLGSIPVFRFQSAGFPEVDIQRGVGVARVLVPETAP